MTVLFECSYQGRRYAGFDRPAPGGSFSLYPVEDGQLRAAVLTAGTAAAAARIAAEVSPIEVPADAAGLTFLPPFLPRDSGNAMVSGFMGTHRSKFDQEPSVDEEFVPPNWFFKGFGSWLRMPGAELVVPRHAVALIEEPEVVLVYLNDDQGQPRYAGYTFGNDLCDIGLHRQNPGWNPYCKLCDTALAPWLFPDAPPSTVTGLTRIERAGEVVWEGKFSCGADSLYFDIDKMAEHLFSYPALHRPGMVHYVLLGADQASFHDGFRIAHADRISLEFTSHDVSITNDITFADAALRQDR